MTLCVRRRSSRSRQEGVKCFNGLSNLGIKRTVIAVLIETLLNVKVAGTYVTGAVREHG
jgi:hypothetical protein